MVIGPGPKWIGDMQVGYNTYFSSAFKASQTWNASPSLWYSHSHSRQEIYATDTRRTRIWI